MGDKRFVGAHRQLHALFSVGVLGDLTDSQLLAVFHTQGDESAELAFRAIVDRHGAMVLGVCQTVLHNSDDARDAFQATFLVLVKKSRGLRVQESLAPWLHQVAYRTACHARGVRARRRRHELAAGLGSNDVDGLESADELRGILAEEIERLPERYRAAVVHCLIQGQTPEQAAGRLGWPAGTVRSRLARGRERLRERLTRRGLVPSVVLAMNQAAIETVPGGLVEVTVQAGARLALDQSVAGVSTVAVSLMEGVVKMMFLSKLKIAAPVVLAGAMVFGTGLAGYRALGRPQATEKGKSTAVAKEGEVSRPADGPKGLAAIGKARLEIAKQLRDATFKRWELGNIGVSELLPVQKRYTEITLEVLPIEGGGRVKFLEAEIKAFRDLEALVKPLYERGQIQERDLLMLELARLDDEYALIIEKLRE